MSDVKMVPAGELEVMGDESAAMLISKPGTKANLAVVEVVRPAAAAAVADTTIVAEATATAVDREVAERGLVSSQTIEEDAFVVRFQGGTTDVVRATEKDGIISKVTLAPDSVPPGALTTMEAIPDESTWMFGFFGNNGRALWAKRNDGSWWGMDEFARVDTSPVVFDAVGDSTTFGAGATDDDAIATADTWAAKLTASTGYPVNNWGASGARAEEITARLGGISPTATVAGGTIPASGPVALQGMSVEPVRAGAVLAYAAELVLANSVRVKGTVRRTGPASYTFTRLDVGAAIAVPGLVEVSSLFAAEIRARRLILGMGINNTKAFTQDGVPMLTVLDSVKRWYAAATTGLSHRPIVWGVLDRGVTEAPGTPIGDFIKLLEQWLAEKYGGDYCRVRQYLASERALADALIYQPSFVASDADRAAVAAGTVPPSFRVTPTSVHLNPLGHSLQESRLRNHLISKGLS